jgi:DNA primase
MDFAGSATQEFAVSSGSSLDTKELVRQAIDIVELVGGFIPLRRQGRVYVGLCPWHDDTRPSLQVNPQRQSFKCWVCDIGGDIFSFMMQMEGVEFREALAMLADRAGVPLKPVQGRPAGSAEAVDDKRVLYQAMAWAEKQYHDCLLNRPEGEPARQYLQQRGITAESIEKFHLGFAPVERDWLLRRAEGGANRAKILEAIGVLARSTEGGTLYDRFKGRVLFSIRDAQGRPVGLGGRVLPELGSPSLAKYINSPETPLFSKSNLLYGLDVARDAIRKSRRALVMEGYTDCIVAHQDGFEDAVAVLGTALGESHIRILKRFAERIVLILDGDEAGQRRANEVLDLFVAQQVDLWILTLPEGLDPCDFLRQHGAAALTELLATKAVDALDHAFQAKTRGLDFEHDVHGVDRALEEMLAVVARAPRLGAGTDAQRQAREWKLLSTLAMRARVSDETLRKRLKELRRQGARRPVSRPGEATAVARPTEKLSPGQRELLELLVGHPGCWPAARAALSANQLAAGVGRQIYETGCRLLDAGIAPTFSRLMLEFDQPAIKSLLVELAEGAQSKAVRNASPEAWLEKLIQTFQQREAEKQRPAQIEAAREGKLEDNREIAALVDGILRQERSRQGISKPTDG